MDEKYSVDIDSPLDWMVVESIIKKRV